MGPKDRGLKAKDRGLKDRVPKDRVLKAKALRVPKSRAQCAFRSFRPLLFPKSCSSP